MSAFIELIGREWVNPGESFEAYLSFFPSSLAHYQPAFSVGSQFELCEGSHIVITGEILEVIPAT